jgi:hypothetical protein
VLRDGSKGLVQATPGAFQTRSCAWDWRSRVQALCVTPDDDVALRNEFIASVEVNIEYFHARYVAQPNNPYGWIKPGEWYGSAQVGTPWQQDFVTAVFGYAACMGLPISSAAATKLDAFFQWKARSVIMRLGAKDGFWYVNAAPYTMVITPSTSPNYDNGTGPWLANDAAVYAATYAVAPAWLSSTEGTLAAEIFPGERSMLGNLMPAIAYAVRHGVPGAQAAYGRLTSATNWPAVRAAFNQSPVWAVQPSQGAAAPQVPTAPPPSGSPAWLAGKAIGEWIEIPGTSGAGGSSVDAFSGFAFNHVSNEIIIAGAGGHSDSADNRVVSIRISDDAPKWVQRMAPSTSVQMDVPYYTDGKPISRHLYSSLQYVAPLNRVMTVGVRGAYGNAYSFYNVDGFSLDSNTWDKAGTWPSVPVGFGSGAVAIRATGEIWTNGLARWSPVTKAWTQPITKRTNDQIRTPIAHDSLRNQLFTLNWADGEGYSAQALFATRVPVNGAEQITVTFTPSAALNQLIADVPTYAAMDYDPTNDRFLFYCGQGAGAGRIYAVKPNAGNIWDISLLQLSGSTRPPATPGAGINSRFTYVPALKGFILLPLASSNLYFIRTA